MTESVCPYCFNLRSRWTDDPLLLPNGAKWYWVDADDEEYTEIGQIGTSPAQIEARLYKGLTYIKYEHILELRDRIDNLCADLELPAVEWSEISIDPNTGLTSIAKQHIQELRDATEDVLDAMGWSLTDFFSRNYKAKLVTGDYPKSWASWYQQYNPTFSSFTNRYIEDLRHPFPPRWRITVPEQIEVGVAFDCVIELIDENGDYLETDAFDDDTMTIWIYNTAETAVKTKYLMVIKSGCVDVGGDKVVRLVNGKATLRMVYWNYRSIDYFKIRLYTGWTTQKYVFSDAVTVAGMKMSSIDLAQTKFYSKYGMNNHPYQGSVGWYLSSLEIPYTDQSDTITINFTSDSGSGISYDDVYVYQRHYGSWSPGFCKLKRDSDSTVIGFAHPPYPRVGPMIMTASGTYSEDDEGTKGYDAPILLYKTDQYGDFTFTFTAEVYWNTPQEEAEIDFLQSDSISSIQIYAEQTVPVAGSIIRVFWKTIEGEDYDKVNYGITQEIKTSEGSFNMVVLHHHNEFGWTDDNIPLFYSEEPPDTDDWEYQDGWNNSITMPPFPITGNDFYVIKSDLPLTHTWYSAYVNGSGSIGEVFTVTSPPTA